MQGFNTTVVCRAVFILCTTVFISFSSPWSSSPQRQSLTILKHGLSSSCRSHWQKDSPITGTVLGNTTTSPTVWELARYSTSDSKSLIW